MVKLLSYRKEMLATWMFALMSISWAPHAMAQEIPGGPGGGADRLQIYEQAGADPGQIARMKKMSQDYDMSVRPIFSNLVAATQEMHRLSLEPTLDESKILGTQEQINKAMCDMSMAKCRFLISMRQVLNDEQRRRLVEILRTRRSPAGAPAAGP
jgi:Spy/CpxP family protein refolding chaperone